MPLTVFRWRSYTKYNWQWCRYWSAIE